MSAKSLLQGLLGDLAQLHEDAREMMGESEVRKAIVRDLGGNPATGGSEFPPTSLASVTAYRDASEPGLEALVAAIQDFRSYHEALTAFAESFGIGGDAVAEEAYRL